MEKLFPDPLSQIALSQKLKKMDFDLKLKLNGKRLYPTKSVKYQGIKIDENITWIDHINDTAIKLSRANTRLFKIREFVNIKILNSIYYAIFDCQLNCAYIVWGQNRYSISCIMWPLIYTEIFTSEALSKNLLK